MIRRLLDKTPVVPESCYVDEFASIIGNVELGERCSVWPGASVRGDGNCHIVFGDCCNIQDGVIVHGYYEVEFGNYVSLGHGAIVHGAKIGNNVLIGMGATVLDGAEIADNCIVGAGALVTSNKKFEEGSLIIGSPAKAVRKLSEEEISHISDNAYEYLGFLEDYKKTLAEDEEKLGK